MRRADVCPCHIRSDGGDSGRVVAACARHSPAGEGHDRRARAAPGGRVSAEESGQRQPVGGASPHGGAEGTGLGSPCHFVDVLFVDVLFVAFMPVSWHFRVLLVWV